MTVSLPTERPSACLRANEGAVDVWHVDLDTVADEVWDLLSVQERARAARIVRERARARWTSSRGVLRALLGDYLDRDPRELAFELGAHGKPALVDGGGRTHELRFNLSHSDRFMLVAVSTAYEVGIDVECARKRHTPELLRAWTMREATVKCLGTGLGSAPAGDAGSLAALWTAELEVGPHAAAAIAVAGEGVRSGVAVHERQLLGDVTQAWGLRVAG